MTLSQQPLLIAHIADLHHSERMLLGGEFVVDPQTGLNVRLHDVERCLRSFIGQASRFGAKLTIVAGDVYDRCKPTPNEERAAIGSVDALGELGPVLIIPGNHDHPGTPTEATAVESLRRRPNVYVADRPGVFDFFSEGRVFWAPLDQAVPAAATGALARIFVLPWPARSALLVDAETTLLVGEDRNAEISRRLGLLVQAMRALRAPGIPSLLVFHGTITEATINEQPAALQQDIGLRVADLAGFDYVALGHIHQRQSFELEGGGVAAYPGSIERFGFGEEHEDKGGSLVELVPTGSSFTPRVTFAPTPARSYVTLSPGDEGPSEGDAETVYRIQGEVTEAERVEVMARVAAAGARHIVFDLSVKREARVRDPALRQDMSEDALVQRRLETRELPAARVARILDLHRQIARSAQL
jgi:DNA repair exonuclease SbcCD nuclease subunit